MMAPASGSVAINIKPLAFGRYGFFGNFNQSRLGVLDGNKMASGNIKKHENNSRCFLCAITQIQCIGRVRRS